MRTVALAVTAVSAVALAAGGSGHAATPNPRAPSVYLDHALDLMRTNAVYTPTAGWKAVIGEAHRLGAGATTPAGTYGAIRYAVDWLRRAGDLHAVFLDATAAAAYAHEMRQSGARTVKLPTVSLLDRRLGVVVLPSIISPPRSPGARRYTTAGLSRISALERKARPCGWIVDLRGNVGGDMVPMLLSVGPILGDGRVIGFAPSKRSHARSYVVSVRGGALSQPGFTVRAPLQVPPFAPAPPVAVLTGPRTASAGEAVTVAFRGRPDTRSFGAATAGATNGPLAYRLADGAEIRVSAAWDVDRRGRVYRHAIEPDVAVHVPFSRPASEIEAAAEKAASRWLLSTAACARKR